MEKASPDATGIPHRLAAERWRALLTPQRSSAQAITIPVAGEGIAGVRR